jgi:HK97 family phage portal protein
MRLFGFEIFRATEPAVSKQTPATLSTPSSPSSGPGSGWWPMSWVREGFGGAWQRNVPTPVVDVMTFGAVFSCVTLIASDIAKMSLRVVRERSDGVRARAVHPASRVLKRPNHYQTRIMFVLQWVISKLTWGNTYVLKERDDRGEVSALYILDPARVRVLVSSTGDVYYALSEDVLAGIQAGIPAIPASEIIHDICYPLYHPLIGISPIHACGLAAIQGLRIQTNSAKFFANGAALGGVLTAPGAIGDETAKRLKEFWDANYAGETNAGKVAVLGDGMKFEAMTMRSTDAQLIEQLKWTAENVCTCYHVPSYKIGVAPPPAFNNIEALDQQYYSSGLQIHIECIEALLDAGLEIDEPFSTEFDLDDLLRMDSATLIDVQAKGVGAGVVAPNEARRKLNLPPVKGGDSPLMQQQNYSLAALFERDQAGPAPSTVAPPAAQRALAALEERLAALEAQRGGAQP